MTAVSERFQWAVEVLDIKPRHTILEIGCGSGMLAEQIARRLTTGHIQAIDKSSSMIKNAEKRNRSYIEAGRASFYIRDFIEMPVDRSFDTIVAFNVNFFLKSPTSKETDVLQNLLKPKGRLYVFYQAPYEIDMTAATPIVAFLTNGGFTIQDELIKKMTPSSVVCVIAEKQARRT